MWLAMVSAPIRKRSWRHWALGMCLMGSPVYARAEVDLAAALAMTATTERRVALETVLERGATPRERAIAGVRLAELWLLLAETQNAQRVLSTTDRSQLDRDDRRSFDRMVKLR